MSLDMHLYCDHCELETHHHFNITHNLSEMWQAAISEKGWLEIDELSGSESLSYLEKGLNELKAKPDYFKQFDSPNGWGQYHDLVDFIERLISAAMEYPKLKWRTSR